VNGESFKPELIDGYACLDRSWVTGDQVVLEMDIQPRRLYANSHVRKDAGCVALMHGPVVYCFEEIDNGKDLSALRIPHQAELQAHWIEDRQLGKIMTIDLQGSVLTSSELLYSEEPPALQSKTLRAIPYYLWGNRGRSEMRVWMLEM
jgi:DUF1680 family protein